MRSPIKKSGLILSLCCGWLLLPQRGQAKDFLWRVRSPTATVYLLGSVHLLRSTDYPLPASFAAAYNTSQQVVFEVDLDEASSPTFTSYVSSKANYPNSQTIRAALNSATYQKLQNFAISHGRAVTFFDPYRPWFASVLVSSLLAEDAGLQTTLGVDQHYSDAAKAAGKPRLFLETPAFQIDTFASVPESEYASSLGTQIDTGKQQLLALVDGWRAGNLSAVAQIIDAGRLTSPESYRRIFLIRNTNFVAQIEGFLKQSKTTLVIVGAGHLIGNDGVVTQLLSRNYNVVQLPGTSPSVGSLTLDYFPAQGAKLTFAEFPATRMLVEQTSFTITAPVTGDGPFAPQWLKNGEHLPGATNMTFSKDFIRSADSGTYQVNIQSEFGTITSSSVRLEVVSPSQPRLDVQRSRAGITLTLKGTTNAHYRVEFADQLPRGPWQPLTNFTLLIDQQTLFDRITNGSRFYRASVGATSSPAMTPPKVVWARSAGGSDADEAMAVAADQAGNVFITGSFIGTAAFGNLKLSSHQASDRDIFVAKYDTSGNLLWARSAGSDNDDYSRGIAVDKNGNCFITGTVGGVATFGTGAVTKGAYVAKYNSAGTLLWAKAGSSQAIATAIAVDNLGNAFATEDSTLIKLNGNGDPIFRTLYATGSSFVFGLAIAVDTSGNSYVTGQLSGQAAIGNASLTSIGGDMFLAKFDSKGTPIWARNAGSGQLFQTATGFGVHVDSSGNSCVIGVFGRTATFGKVTLTSNGSDAMFVAKYDGEGNVIWAKQPLGGGTSTGYGIATDQSGDIYTSGYFSGSITFGSATLSAERSVGSYVAKFDSDGNVAWAIQAGGGGGVRIAHDQTGELFVAGSFREASAMFGETTLTSSGFYDVFLFKLKGP